MRIIRTRRLCSEATFVAKMPFASSHSEPRQNEGDCLLAARGVWIREQGFAVVEGMAFLSVSSNSHHIRHPV